MSIGTTSTPRRTPMPTFGKVTNCQGSWGVLTDAKGDVYSGSQVTQIGRTLSPPSQRRKLDTCPSRRASTLANCRYDSQVTQACKAEGIWSERAWLASKHIHGFHKKAQSSQDAVAAFPCFFGLQGLRHRARRGCTRGRQPSCGGAGGIDACQALFVGAQRVPAWGEPTPPRLALGGNGKGG
jgi:hypothetical protein